MGFIAGDSRLGRRWHIGQQGRALIGRDKQHPRRAAILKALQDGRDIGAELNFARGERGKNLPAAAIGHMNGIGPRAHTETGRGDMAGSANAGGAILIAPRRSLQGRDEFRGRGGREIARGDGKRDGHKDGRRHRHQIGPRIKGHRGRQAAGECNGRKRGEHKNIAIGGLLRHVIRANHAARAGAVFQYHRLAQDFRHFGCQKPRGDIRPAAGAEGDDDPDGPARPRRLGIGGAGQRAQRQRGGDQATARYLGQGSGPSCSLAIEISCLMRGWARQFGDVAACKRSCKGGLHLARNGNKCALPQSHPVLQALIHAPHLVVPLLWQDYIL